MEIQEVKDGVAFLLEESMGEENGSHRFVPRWTGLVAVVPSKGTEIVLLFDDGTTATVEVKVGL